MKIGSIQENLDIEKRIAITPEIVKKYTSLGFDVILSKNYGSHIGIEDEQYKNIGVQILKDETEILNSSDKLFNLECYQRTKPQKLKKTRHS